ncbi:MAG: inositol monophosphatase [Actinobacteria bacterium]|nr:inositol monophosphatase [Actinomycetota bacterium]
MEDELVELASRVAEDAGDLLLSYASRTLEFDTKSSATDPVSEADHASEETITGGLLEARPDDGVLGEENASNRAGTSGLRWVIDPLDGTVNFLYGIPAWCVSIACEDEHGMVVGVVRDPHRRETFAARRGGGALCNGRPLQVRSSAAELSMALVATGFGYGPAVRERQGRWVADLLPRVRDVRRVGAAALDLAWLAAGRFDAFYEFGLQPWDRAAGQLLVQEAGGVVSLHQLTVGSEEGTCIFAGHRPIHDALSTWLLDEIGVQRAST